MTFSYLPDDTPKDYLDPQWDKAGRVHEWKNYISEEVQAMWPTFTPEVRAALARQAEDNASREEWV